MPSWIVALILAVGVTAWSYNKLARSNGNASPSSNFLVASLVGLIVFLVMLSLMSFVLDF